MNNIYFITGQSNAGAKESANAVNYPRWTEDQAIPSTNAKTWWDPDSPPASWDTYQIGVNSNNDVETTSYGPEVGLAFWLKKFNPYFIKFVRSATPIVQRDLGEDFSPNSTGERFDELETAFTNALGALSSSTSRIRGWVIAHGENEAQQSTEDAALALESAYADYFKAAIDAIEALGWSTAQMNIHVMRLSNLNGGTWASTVRTQQAGFVNTFKSDFPAYSSKVNNIYLTDTDDLPFTDVVHYTKDSIYDISKRIAKIEVPRYV